MRYQSNREQKHTCRRRRIETLLREYLKEQDVDTATRYVSVFVDLNDDGKQEIIVYVLSQSLCGTGGCPTLILAPTLSSFKIIRQVTITWPPILVLPTKAKGWHNIAVWVQGGGIQPGYEAELRYDGNSYPSNPTVPPARRLRARMAGKVVIAENPTGTPLN